MTLVAVPTATSSGNRVGLALLEKHYYYEVQPGDSPTTIATGIAAAFSSDPDFSAISQGAAVTITWKQNSSPTGYGFLRGANGNRITAYGFCTSGQAVWQQPFVTFSGGQFPLKYSFNIDFSSLTGHTDGNPGETVSVPTQNVRKLRWTWAADLQAESFAQLEYSTVISNWYRRRCLGNNIK